MGATAGNGFSSAAQNANQIAAAGDARYQRIAACGRLYKSGANLVFGPYRGNLLTCNRRICTIPNGGLTLAPPTMTCTMTIASPGVVTFNNHGLVAGSPVIFNTTGALPTGVTAGTTYYVIATGLTANAFQFSATIGGSAVNTSGTQSGVHTLTGPVHLIYATDTNGVLSALSAELAAAAPHSTSTDDGTEIKTGDTTKALVGMARTVNGAWVDSLSQRFVASYHNRLALSASANFTTNRTVTGSWSEFNSEIRVQFLSWADEVVSANYSGGGFINISADQYDISFSIDSVTTPEEGAPVLQGSTAIYPIGCALHKSGLAEGYHFVTMIGNANSGSSGVVLCGTATVGRRGAIWLRLMG